MKTILTFVIPVRHPENAKNWQELKSNLAATIRSISLQDNKAWKAIIVANRNSDLPSLPSKASVKWVDFPPNKLYEQGAAKKEEFYEAIRSDKGKRLLAGMLEAGETEYIMVVDDDDFINKHLTTFVEKNRGCNGWYVKDGYIWSQGSRLVYQYSDFSKLCGTSHIIRSDLYNLPESGEATSETYIQKMLGSHIFIREHLSTLGTPLLPLPFFGAIYRVGHKGSHSNSHSVFSSFLLERSLIRRPKETLRRIFSFRLLSKAIKNDFFS